MCRDTRSRSVIFKSDPEDRCTNMTIEWSIEWVFKRLQTQIHCAGCDGLTKHVHLLCSNTIRRQRNHEDDTSKYSSCLSFHSSSHSGKPNMPGSSVQNSAGANEGERGAWIWIPEGHRTRTLGWHKREMHVSHHGRLAILTSCAPEASKHHRAQRCGSVISR